MKIWYARVSSIGQSLELQIKKLRESGCEKIFQEKKSGTTKLGRHELKKALDYVRDGDVLYITKLDRLARSLKDLTNIAHGLNEKGVGFVVLDQNINTTNPTGKLIFHLIWAIGEFERSLIIERTQEGRIAAKNRGVKFGANKKLSPEQIEGLKADFNSSKLSKVEIAAKYGVGRATVYRIYDQI